MIWVIGDIHGMLDPLKRIMEIIRLEMSPSDPVSKIIFLGDYIDHGPSSKEVIDYVLGLDFETVLLAGNHEDMAARFVKGDKAYLESLGNNWLLNGVAETYLSLCGDRANIHKARQVLAMVQDPSAFGSKGYEGLELPRRYERFLASLRYSHREVLAIDGREVPFHFSHGLPHPGDPLAFQRQKTRRELDSYLAGRVVRQNPALKGLPAAKKARLARQELQWSAIWGRDYNFGGYDGEVVVHGHTPTLYYDRYKAESGPSGQAPQPLFRDYDPKSLLPFLFLRFPEASFEEYYDFQARADLESLGAPRGWPRFEAAGGFRAKGELGVEAINVDTGCVMGGALTALGLSESLLSQGWLLVMSCQSGSNQRNGRGKILKRALKVWRMGGPDLAGPGDGPLPGPGLASRGADN
jgi:hypothetical protein